MSHESGLRIVFAGTPDFAVPPLQALIDNGFVPAAVYTQPDRPAGRGRHLQASPVKQAAERAGIPVHQPVSLRDSDSLQALERLAPDLMIVVAYGLILPNRVLEAPTHGCWNIHASLLPRWRGAAPIQRAIEAGDAETGVCVMEIDEGLDTGPVMHTVRTPIGADETGGSLHDKLARTGAEAILHCVRLLAAGEPPQAMPQAETGAVYARKLDKAEARIDWNEPAITLERRIRAFNPWPVTWCMAADERTRIWAAQRLSGNYGEAPGTVLSSGKHGIDVATGDGVLRLLELQRPGKRRMAAHDYLNAGGAPDFFE